MLFRSTVKLIESDPENDFEGTYKIEFSAFVAFVGFARKLISLPKFSAKLMFFVFLFVFTNVNNFEKLFSEIEKDP